MLVIDLEGTCGETIPDDERETLEIGAVILDDTNYQVQEKFSILTKPTRHPELTQLCKQITGISQEEVDLKGIYFSVAMREFCAWFSKHHRETLSGFYSWGPYDLNQLKRDCEYWSVTYPFTEHLDLSKMFTEKTGRRRGHRKAMAILGVKAEGKHHRGLDDALNISKMVPLLLGDIT